MTFASSKVRLFTGGVLKLSSFSLIKSVKLNLLKVGGASSSLLGVKTLAVETFLETLLELFLEEDLLL